MASPALRLLRFSRNIPAGSLLICARRPIEPAASGKQGGRDERHRSGLGAAHNSQGGVGIGAGLLSGAISAHAQGASAAAGEEIWSSEYWAQKGNVRLNLWRKRAGAPKAGEKPLPVLFLVHGSSNSTRTTFDLTVPGKGEYSFMNVFARYGFDVWTMDHDGYGHSGSSGNNSDIASGVEDLKAAIPVVAAGDRPSQGAFLRLVVRRASAPPLTRRRSRSG